MSKIMTNGLIPVAYTQNKPIKEEGLHFEIVKGITAKIVLRT